jgi:hypothetical protein
MNVKPITIKLLTGAVLFILCCSGCNENQDNEYSPSLAASMIVEHRHTGRRAPTWERITIPNVYVYGDITGNPLPAINSIQVAGKQYGNAASFYDDQGIMHFSPDESVWLDEVAEPGFSPLSVHLETSLGTLSGSIYIPDTVKTLQINASDTISLGTSFTISWTGSNADYYFVAYYHEWMEVEDDAWFMLGYSRDTVVTGNDVTFGASLTAKDGEISEIRVYPVNGPFPVPGAQPNMTGVGYGYLFAENQPVRATRTVVFGDGIDPRFFEFSTRSKSTRKAQAPALLDILQKRMGIAGR